MAEHPHAERLRRGYDAFASQDLDTLRELIAEDAVWHATASGRLSGDYNGHDDIFGFFMRLYEETGGTVKIDVHDVLANDDHAVGIVLTSAERNGRRLDQKTVHVFNMTDDGRVSEFWGFTEDTAAANEFFS